MGMSRSRDAQMSKNVRKKESYSDKRLMLLVAKQSGGVRGGGMGQQTMENF